MDKRIDLFGFDISFLPKWAILLLGIIGIFASFILQGYSHEAIFGKFKMKEALFLTFVQFFVYSSISFKFFIDLARKKTILHAPFWFYLITAFALVGSMALSNYSLERISYPTQVLFRSSKLIPVMLGSYFFLRKRYSHMEVISVFLTVAGLVGISMSDKKVNNKLNPIGLVAVISSLFCDAFASNLEEKAFATYQAPQNEVIAMVYLIGSIIIGIASIPVGQFTSGMKRVMTEPVLDIQILLFSSLGAVGIQFIYLLINTFGSVVTVMVTSLRKAFTVCLSFLFFSDKKFTRYHLMSIICISFGIGMNIYGKQKSKSARRLSDLPDKSKYVKQEDVPDNVDIGALAEKREDVKFA
ncbi:solute carrier protein, putative [Trichomonas vaginalis G3]|uniref:Solute carrier protein, putative n=1 Tax=Trichomonas vaginalis (strain ATCC PRA-98 / G3) TaxID=412133 RepID=A2DPH0_TRIV3|nr:3'-phosphoadenosine 5'-phosphosulfate transmembrane transporter protein [Trichomonas vaginalis G3]EAY17714.1 solute carrier protein, putative [Trichomonas vaginalis G3]KAI5507882.1 3'-phosphoadenosine 5'-phosphosulfate transmembrane transporter protein [Trichomonas vaginalis G3]|eukprot:XP_001329849.1 solute carrier protein [Trichomonas vaginalis G3]